MSYYILYPKKQTAKVKIMNKRPNAHKNYGFAEGSYQSKRAVMIRLNQMNVSKNRRPKGY